MTSEYPTKGLTQQDSSDVEKNDRKGSVGRVGGGLRGSTVSGYAVDSVDKQMELEAGNAIKYRTCSWQKVSLGNRRHYEHNLTKCLDCFSAVQRVHLPGYNVVSVLVLGSWSCSWYHMHSCRCSPGSVHELDHLAILSQTS